MASIHASVNDDLLISMEDKLGDLAALWRGYKDTEVAGEIVHQYQAILKCMIELGHQRPLDIESELPKRFMPREYLERLGRA